MTIVRHSEVYLKTITGRFARPSAADPPIGPVHKVAHAYFYEVTLLHGPLGGHLKTVR
jgi:hypothetical protein